MPDMYAEVRFKIRSLDTGGLIGTEIPDESLKSPSGQKPREPDPIYANTPDQMGVRIGKRIASILRDSRPMPKSAR